jgi:restriction endonuclease S subunit
MSMGSAQQDINLKMLRKLPVPILEQNEIDKVVALVNEAFDLREKADELELSAIKEIEDLIEQESGTH